MPSSHVTFASVLRATDAMGYWAHTSSVPRKERLANLDTVVGQTVDNLQTLGESATPAERLSKLHTEIWLACLPSVRAIAAGLPHSAAIAAEVRGNLSQPLRTLLEGATAPGRELPVPNADGLLGEAAVWGVLLWAHMTYPNRGHHRVLPATASQDKSRSRRIPQLKTGFDLLYCVGNVATPVQTKVADIHPPQRHRDGKVTTPYKNSIAVVYLPRLFAPVDQAPDRTTRLYAAELLAEAVLVNDEAVLAVAANNISHFLRGVRPRARSAERYYSKLAPQG